MIFKNISKITLLVLVVFSSCTKQDDVTIIETE